ncbi:MAG: SDR family oxidoreductase [Gemmatimonadota bacterium]
MRIVVTGGTGTVGKRLVRLLAERGADVGVMTRNPDARPPLPEGASYVEGDFADSDSVLRAVTGADAVYLLTPLVPNEAELGRDAVWAIVDARVEKIVFQSVHRVEDGSHIPHFRSKIEIAAQLKQSGVDWTIVAPNNFYQNDLNFRPMLTGPGVYPQPLGPVGVSHVDCDDIAAVAARCLMESGHAGRTYAVVGPEAHTGEENAAIWAEALDRPIHYIGDDLDAWAAQMGEHMPDWLVDDLVIMYRHFIEHGLLATDDDLAGMRQLLGRHPTSYKKWVTETAERWMSQGAG